MRKTVSSLLVLGSQMLIVGLFFTTVFSKNVNVSKHVSTVHNDNLNKIATSVSLLFEEDSLAKVEDKVESMTIEELPSIAKVSEDASKIEEEVKVEEPIKNEPVKEKTDIAVDDTLFEYICNKSGMYKIYLNEGEKLIIKD